MRDLAAKPSLNLLVIRAENPQRLCEFYTALGLRFVREQHGAGPVHHASEIGGSVFEIYPRSHNEPPTAGARLGFNVPSLDRALEALSMQSVSPISGPTETPRGRRAVVRDPEGHRIELIERLAQAD
jgi:catechol 2,3-dioxygenase-like lactoylglutathione lyase family enzyme